MSKKKILIPFVLITVLFFTLFAPYASNTEIFTPQNIPGTEHNLNPDTLKKISNENSNEALSLMQDTIDLSGTIIINIRYKNIDDALEDLEEYKNSLGKFDNIVINLDMTQTEIDEYRKNDWKQIENLEKLAEQIDNLDDLKKLQVQYRDSDDGDKYYSVTYQIEKLKEEIVKKKEELSETTEKKIEYSKNYDLQTENLEKSTEEIKNIALEEIREPAVIFLNPVSTTSPSSNPLSTTSPSLTAINKSAETSDNHNEIFLILFVFITIALIFSAVSYLYFIKKTEPKKYIRSISQPVEEKKIDYNKLKSEKSSIKKEYLKLLSNGFEHEAFKFLTKTLFCTVSIRENVQYNPSMTNNEFLSQLPEKENLKKFTKLYEKIVYSKLATDDDKNRLYEVFIELIELYKEELI